MALPQLTDLIGDEIVALRRIHYIVNETDVHDPNGPLQLTMRRGGAIWFDAGANGEALRVTWSTWMDDFTEPLSHENRAYVAASGKWTSLDVTNQAPYSHLLGEVVSVYSETNAGGEDIGIVLHTRRALLHAFTDSADEVFVEIDLVGA